MPTDLTAQNVTMTPLPVRHDAKLTPATKFRDFLAHALQIAWVSGHPQNPNANCNFGVPVTPQDVNEIRIALLNTLEITILNLWSGDNKPGDGWQDYHSEQTSVGTGEFQWRVRLDHDSLMLDLETGEDPITIWLNYGALLHRHKVIQNLKEAEQHVPGYRTWDRLQQAAN